MRETAEQVFREQRAKEEAEVRSSELLQQKVMAEQQLLQTKKIASVVTAFLVVLLFEVTVNWIVPWNWLLNHPNSFGLQGCISLMAFFAVLGAWVKPWRNVLWVVGVLGALFVTLQIIGGRTKAP